MKNWSVIKITKKSDKKRSFANRILSMLSTRNIDLDDPEADIFDNIDPNITWNENKIIFAEKYPSLLKRARKGTVAIEKKPIIEKMKEEYKIQEETFLKIGEELEKIGQCNDIYSWIESFYKKVLEPHFENISEIECNSKIELHTLELQEKLKNCSPKKIFMAGKIEKILPGAEKRSLLLEKELQEKFKKTSLQKFLKEKELPFSGLYSDVINRIIKNKFTISEIDRFLSD